MRLIDADELLSRLQNEKGYKGMCKARLIVIGMPTIEPEVRHGRWKWAAGYVGTMAECSVCGMSPMSFYSLPKNQIGRLPVYKYCPRCGAKMSDDETKK